MPIIVKGGGGGGGGVLSSHTNINDLSVMVPCIVRSEAYRDWEDKSTRHLFTSST